MLKSTSLFQGGGKEVNQPASSVHSVKVKMNYQCRGELLQHLDLYLQPLEPRAGKQNARHRRLLTSWWCLFPVEPTPLQTTTHADARLAGANFHSGKIGKPCQFPSPPTPVHLLALSEACPRCARPLFCRSPQFCI